MTCDISASDTNDTIRLVSNVSVSDWAASAFGTYAQLIVPTGFTCDKASDSPARHTFSSTTLLTITSMFSLYIPYNILLMAKFQTFVQALYERIVDLRRLYIGKGGVVLTPEEHTGSPLPDREHTPATTELCATIIPFDTYDECVGEGQQPRASLGAAIFAKSPGGDDALPEYDDAERQHNVLNASNKCTAGVKTSIYTYLLKKNLFETFIRHRLHIYGKRLTPREKVAIPPCWLFYLNSNTNKSNGYKRMLRNFGGGTKSLRNGMMR
ncbi:hypothetical protein CI238_13408 [Colletotrichum incanum]|uniref:Uncharacterized protein n=1 Tax=Colletotrichum incanum TaxID=1573173 RepID=A0A162NX30_COLIC|nr:hypothetical protein CI238_13408 [Colletotrichum incanum]OHW96529.1 hypothetical protein CSPAE12_04822 [Colletotrichum incanum]